MMTRPGLIASALLLVPALLLPACEQKGAVSSTVPPPAEAAPAQPVSVGGTFRAISTTASSITGDAVIDATSVTFSLGLSYTTSQVSSPTASSDMGGGAGTFSEMLIVPPVVPLDVRAVTAQTVSPKAPNGGLCGPLNVTHIALAVHPALTGGSELALAAFSGTSPPGGVEDPKLCATFSYMLAAE